jgi:hypothetical protein
MSEAGLSIPAGIPHPLNPLKVGIWSSRPAGAPFRPAQVWSHGHRCALTMNRLMLHAGVLLAGTADRGLTHPETAWRMSSETSVAK